MRRALLLALTITAAFLSGPTAAQAAITCPGKTLSVPRPNSSTVAFDWTAKCNGAMWQAEFQIQYQSGGNWIDATCASGGICDAQRPSPTSFYPAGSSHGGTITFDVINTNGCLQRWRELMYLKGAGGTVLGPFASTPSVIC